MNVMRLTDRFVSKVEYKGQQFELNLSFDNVLRVLELIEDNLFSSTEKLIILFQMLVKNADEIKISFNGINDFIGFLFENFLFPKKDNGPKKKSYFDFKQDAAFIYASFLQDYKIDLFEMQGVLHWHKFLALLDSLSEKTKFKEVVGIRAQKIPSPTKYNQEERKRLIELKQLYRLENEKPSVDEADQMLSSISAALKKSYLKGR